MKEDSEVWPEVEREIEQHLQMPAGVKVKLWVSEKQNRSEIRPRHVQGVGGFNLFEVFVPPDWLERKYKPGIWRGFDVHRTPYLVVQFGWGNERSGGRQGFAQVKALRYLNRSPHYDPPHLMTLSEWRFGLHALGATYLSDHSFDDCWKGAECHAAEMLGVKLP